MACQLSEKRLVASSCTPLNVRFGFGAGDLVIEAPVGTEEFSSVRARRIPHEAEARRVILLQIDLRHAGGTDDLLPIPANACVQREVLHGPTVLQVERGDLVLS